MWNLSFQAGHSSPSLSSLRIYLGLKSDDFIWVMIFFSHGPVSQLLSYVWANKGLIVARVPTSLESNQPRTVAAQTSWHRLQHVLIDRIKPLQAQDNRELPSPSPHSPRSCSPSCQGEWAAAVLGGGKLPLIEDFHSSQVRNQAAKAKCVKM